MDIEKEHDSNKKELEFQSYVPAEQTPPELSADIVDKGVGSAFVLLDVFGALSLLLGKVSLAGGFLRLFFLLFDQFSGESFGHFHLFFGRHPG